MRLSQFTTRRLMVLVALCAVALGVIIERRARFSRLAQDHRAMRVEHELDQMAQDPGACPMTFRSLWHSRMAAKYERAARYPWLPVAPDTPPPVVPPRTSAGVARLRLESSGWSVAGVIEATPSGDLWCVYGRNGENIIRTEGRSRDEAWKAAIEQARELGMLID